ncbi:MAG: [FeFe] hydrogenase, group A [Peptostreptococcaceae bacterium]|nr:[FeFe] hydrogenase, group A [Peptostreptococcaceae bacterium]
MGIMRIDGERVEFDVQTNVLEVVRKAGIELPTFCYHSELSIYGACRMCIVEDQWGKIFAACSTQPQDGMEIYTHTEKLLRYRRTLLELILAEHESDCTRCRKSGRCTLQALAERFYLHEIRFEKMRPHEEIDRSSRSIVRDPNKCILCGDCVRTCEEVQGVGALSFAYRGSDVRIAVAFNRELSTTDCVSCGQCRSACPTGAITIRNDIPKVWKALHDKKKRVVAQIAPAVRVAVGEQFGMKPGEVPIGKVITALRRIGFEDVYDTAFAADMTVMEESAEFVERWSKGENLPLFTSCCPGWVKFVETRHPDLLPQVSTCKSPQQMFGTVIKEYYREKDAKEGRETFVVSIMPCTAKKAEAARREFIPEGVPDVDIVITTQELARLIKESGLLFHELVEDSFDMPFGMSSGSGIIFGTTGGVCEAVIRRLIADKPDNTSKNLVFDEVRGLKNIKEAKFEVDGREVKVAIVHGLKNANDLLKEIKEGDRDYDFVEVMACSGGCIAGGGQPVPIDGKIRADRAKGLYNLDNMSFINSSESNPMIVRLYEEVIRGNHGMLHVHKH